jgi:hypothetical protein
MVMEAAQFYRPPAADPVALGELSRADLEARVTELERVVATLATLRNERTADRRDDRPDPVALTRALHPRGMRSARTPMRRTSNDGTIRMRIVAFRPPTSR